MGYYAGKMFPEMIADLDSSAYTAVNAALLKNWGETLTKAVAEGKNSLLDSANSVRAGWTDAAGDSFETRVRMAVDSMEPWADWKLPADELYALPAVIQSTRTVVEEAKAAYDAEQAALQQGPSLVTDGVAVDLTDGGGTDAGNGTFAQMAGAAGALQRARDAMDALDQHFTDLAGRVQNGIPTTSWDGPQGNVGGPPAAPGAPNRGTGNPSDATPGDTPGGDQAGEQAADQAGQDAAAADAGAGETPGGDGTGLAGTPTPTLPTVPTYPTGPATPPASPLIPVAGGIPYPPITPLKPFDPKGFNGLKGGGSGLGGSVVGGGGYYGTGKNGLGGGGLGKPGTTGTGGPAQAARQMGGRGVPTVPEAPVLPGSSAPAAGAAAGGTGSVPPPMMPPMGMGGGGNKPKPGTATPPLQGQGRSQNKLPGVPQKLRGRSGKSDPTSGPGAFGAAAATRRRRSEEKEPVDTVQLLDEELWAVEEPPAAPAAPAPAPKQRRLGGR